MSLACLLDSHHVTCLVLLLGVLFLCHHLTCWSRQGIVFYESDEPCYKISETGPPSSNGIVGANVKEALPLWCIVVMPTKQQRTFEFYDEMYSTSFGCMYNTLWYVYIYKLTYSTYKYDVYKVRNAMSCTVLHCTHCFQVRSNFYPSDLSVPTCPPPSFSISGVMLISVGSRCFS
jgi:hypothetical protein